MTITITAPKDNDKFSLQDDVVFEGTASNDIVRIELWAENRWKLHSIAVSSGVWSTSYKFTKAGIRQIQVKGFDVSEHEIELDSIQIQVIDLITCQSRKELFKIGTRSVWQLSGQNAFFYKSRMSIDADGAPNAYHPSDTGIDTLANAGKPGNWWALVTDNGRPDGNPLVQKSSDPFPAYYISATALVDGRFDIKNPQRYVDATKIPYIVLPGAASIRGTSVKKGDLAAVFNGNTRKLAFAIFADVGPNDELGEGSIALSQALGHDPFVSGKVKKSIPKDVFYVVFPGSGNGKPKTLADINSETEPLFKAWGGLDRIEACFQEI
jgi:hypothetical protein